MDDYIFGKNAVKEAFKNDVEINKMYIQKESNVREIQEVINMAKKNKIVIQYVGKGKLDEISERRNHQGIAISISPYKYVTVEEILKDKENPFVVILDEIQDPHNLGAIIRTAYAAGVDGIIIPSRRSALINSTVVKTSAGYVMHMPVAKVTNISKTIEYLKKHNIWIVGAAMSGETKLFNANLKGGLGIVVGSEGSGLSRLVMEKCDFLVNIPMKNSVESLNVSVAASLVMYEAFRQRENNE